MEARARARSAQNCEIIGTSSTTITPTITKARPDGGPRGTAWRRTSDGEWPLAHLDIVGTGWIAAPKKPHVTIIIPGVVPKWAIFGPGTIVALMLPYLVGTLIAWLALFIVWYLAGIPLGPGDPVAA